MSEILVRTDTREVLLYSPTTIGRPAYSGANETLVTVTTLPTGIAKFTTRYTTGGALEQVTQPTVDLGADILAQATNHATRLTLLMNTVWLVDAAGERRPLVNNNVETEIGQRWANTFYWLLCPLAAINGIVSSTNSQWTDNVASQALDAYRSLIPLDPERIDFWYHNHNASVWASYRRTAVPGDNGAANVWFRWARDAAIPSFAADANSSTLWDGTNNTLAITLPKTATTASEVLA